MTISSDAKQNKEIFENTVHPFVEEKIKYHDIKNKKNYFRDL